MESSSEFSDVVTSESLVVISLSCEADSLTDNASFIKVSASELLLVSSPSKELFTWLQHISDRERKKQQLILKNFLFINSTPY